MRKNNNMARLILHVGPGKCGSSSIQKFFNTHQRTCLQNTRYEILEPSLICELNSKECNDSLLDIFSRKLSRYIEESDHIILSHEFLFQNPYAIRNICLLAASLVEKTIIIGYSRRQSDFLVSAYSQWWFRSRSRVNEVSDVLIKLGIDPLLFTGLERQFIASIHNDFHSSRMLSGYHILDWHRSYNTISKLIDGLNVVIKCGILPNKESANLLIEDFCAKANIILDSRIKDASNITANISFNHNIIEAINNAVVFGLEMIGPHDSNDTVSFLSSMIEKKTIKVNTFLLNLKLYIDSYFLRSNTNLCKKYGLDENYFTPSIYYRKQHAIEMISDEVHNRCLHKSAIIENYRLLSAKMVEMSINLANNNLNG
jgi:hypothetical protein